MEENKNELMVKDFSELNRGVKNNASIYTTITDEKTIFNLEDACDYKINDCKGEMIRVKDVLIKRIEKDLKEPIVDELTGEIIKDKELKLITILIDDEGKSYVTASKTFGFKFIKYIEMFGLEEITKNGLEIKIIETSVKNSNNKALSFALV